MWFATEFDVPTTALTPSVRLVEDLGLDSLDAVALLIAIEERFDVALTDADARQLRTLGDVAVAIEACCTRRAHEAPPNC